MRIPKRGEKGFTLIELLIVVAILGVLAAVVIPNVGRFIGRGETEAAETEFSNMQSAVIAMMTDNGLSILPGGTFPATSGNATNDMFAFPSTAAIGAGYKYKDPNGNLYVSGGPPRDNAGYVLYKHDITGNTDNGTLVNYVATRWTKGTYFVDASGTVTQHESGY